MKFYLLYREDGCYDAVLDDQEPLYEILELHQPEDSVQQSEPTEVFKPIDLPELTNNNLPPNEPVDYLFPHDPRSMTRSLTSSPFTLQTKPYRPFSTEPIEVPALEDPIILNPNYEDEFPEIDEDCLPKTRFKLPVSEQYNPELWGGKSRSVSRARDVKTPLIDAQTGLIDSQFKTDSLKEVKFDGVSKFDDMTDGIRLDEALKVVQKSEEKRELKYEERMMVEEVKIAQKAKSEIDLVQIEKTAVNVVEECLDKAVSVSEEIKEQINVELSSVMKSDEASRKESVLKTESKKIEDVSVSQEVVSSAQVDEKSIRQAVSESKSIVDEKQRAVTDVTDAQKTVSKTDSVEVKSAKHVEASSAKSKSETRVQTGVKDRKTNQTSKKYSTAKLLAEQRAYTIGLQTIPKIRGNLRASCHYNLLLKTFFIHLTDVMVALSRFIISEPVFDDEKAYTEVEEKMQEDTEMHQEVITEDRTVRSDIKEEIATKVEQAVDLQINAGEVREEETHVEEKKKLTGSEMAQRSQRKTIELTDKMDAVITEFQHKTGIEETQLQASEDPIDWIARTEKKSESRTMTEHSSESKTTEQISSAVITEKRDERRSRSKDRQTYVAIVESHCYTNKELLEEQFSETSSVSETAEVVATSEIEKASKEIVTSDKQVTEAQKTSATEVFERKIEEQSKVEEKMEFASSKVHGEAMTAVIIEKTVDTAKKDEVYEFTDKTEAVAVISEALEAVMPVNQEQVTEIHVEKSEETTKVETEQFTAHIEQVSAQVVQTKQVTSEIQQFSSHTEQITEKTELISAQTTSKEVAVAEMKSNLETQEQAFLEAVSQKIEAITPEEPTKNRKLSLNMDQEKKLKKSDSDLSFPSTIDTPSPCTYPPTPLTDEYVFRLECPMPKNEPDHPRSPTPEDIPEEEDPNIVKKKLIPHIESTIERVVYDVPLKTPEEEKAAVFKDGLSDEEILEIGRKSSLLASAIDETIKSIEEYKEQVGMEVNTEPSQVQSNDVPMYNGYVKEAKTTVFTENLNAGDEKVKMEQDWGKVIDQFKTNGKNKVKDDDGKVEEEMKSKVDIIPEEVHIKPAEVEKISTAQVGSIAELSTKVEQSVAVTETVDSMQEIKTKIVESTEIQTHTEQSKIQSKTLESFTVMGQTAEISGFQSQIAQNLPKFQSVTPLISEIQTQPAQNLTEIQTATLSATAFSEQVTKTSERKQSVELKSDPMEGYRPVPFNPQEFTYGMQYEVMQQQVEETPPRQARKTPTGEILGTTQGIVDGLTETAMDPEVAKELGKPGMSEEKIAELLSGESEMLREAHVMGLSRVLTSHMNRPDENSSVDFNKIKPTIERLKDSEVIKALNEELQREKEEKKKKEERKWTTFLQRPQRPVPNAKFGYPAYIESHVEPTESYKVKIVKQPKPKVAPDYKPEDFNTGLLPWEERKLHEPPLPPVAPEDPILIPEETPEFLEAVDPLPESEVPDLEETGIPLPPEPVEPTPIEAVEEVQETPEEAIEEKTEVAEEKVEERELDDMEKNALAEQLVTNVQNMVDPNAPLEQQLSQMRAQLAALAQLPGVIQQTLELVTKQLTHISQQEITKTEIIEKTTVETTEEVIQERRQSEGITETAAEEKTAEIAVQEQTAEVAAQEATKVAVDEAVEETQPQMTQEEMEQMKRDLEMKIDEQMSIDKQKKVLMEQMQLELESRQVKNHPTPRVGKPKPMFGPLTPQERPLILPGGRKWRNAKDAYNDQFFTETLMAQAEIIQGKAMGINFMKYEKPPVSLDHLKDSEVYKLIHNMDEPKRRVELLTPVMCESDYRERCRSMTPLPRTHQEHHTDVPQQMQP